MGEERTARRLVKAVDTNVIARALVRDDPVQAAIADTVLSRGAFVPLTVFIETGWLLRSRYNLSRREVVTALTALTDMPDVVVELREKVRWALRRLSEAGDLADLVHLVAAAQATAFVTFDRSLAAAAGPESPVPIETLEA